MGFHKKMGVLQPQSILEPTMVCMPDWKNAMDIKDLVYKQEGGWTATEDGWIFGFMTAHPSGYTAYSPPPLTESVKGVSTTLPDGGTGFIVMAHHGDAQADEKYGPAHFPITKGGRLYLVNYVGIETTSTDTTHAYNLNHLYFVPFKKSE